MINNAFLEVRKAAVVASMPCKARQQRKSVVAEKFDAFLRERSQVLVCTCRREVLVSHKTFAAACAHEDDPPWQLEAFCPR